MRYELGSNLFSRRLFVFGIGFGEIIVILILALLVVGPKKLPEMAKKLGHAMGEFKKATSELKNTIETETSIADVKKTLNEISVSIHDTTSDVTETARRATSLDFEIEEAIPSLFDSEEIESSESSEPKTEQT